MEEGEGKIQKISLAETSVSCIKNFELSNGEGIVFLSQCHLV